ncbi:MAG TPA: thioredoxin domain-containing protein [Nitrososphaeraceae archaeon]|nr:thioredoxin domain-containing protein [Nitrososphaeraceae archaeon]
MIFLIRMKLLEYKLVSAIFLSAFLLNVYLYHVSAEWKIPSNTNVTPNFTTYENNFVKIDYPTNWIFTETTDSVIFSPDRDSVDKIKINVSPIQNDTLSIKSVVDSTLDEFVRTLDDFELIESSQLADIKDNNHKLIYSYVDGNKNKIQNADVGIIRGANLYTISLTSNYTDYYRNLPIYEKMLASFNYYNEQGLLNQFSSYLLNPVADFVPILGNSSNITIVEFGDYQCTFCAKFHNETRDKIIKNFVDSGKINFIYKDYIVNDIPTDKASTMGAEASYCAGEQGKYWDYHTELYDNWRGERTGWITSDSLKQFAKNIEIPNMTQFSDCIESNKYSLIVQNNDNIARSMGLSGTPSFILIKDNNIQSIIPGALPYEIFEQTLNRLISSKF